MARWDGYSGEWELMEALTDSVLRRFKFAAKNVALVFPAKVYPNKTGELPTMNRISVAILAILTLLVAVSIAQTSQKTSADPAQIGRYQILVVEHDYIGGAPGEKERAVLRLDTATGVVEQWFRGMTKDGRGIDAWEPTGDLPFKSSPSTAASHP